MEDKNLYNLEVQIAISLIENQFEKIKRFETIENLIKEDSIVNFLKTCTHNQLMDLPSLGASKVNLVLELQSVFKERVDILNSISNELELMYFMFHHIPGIKTEFKREFIGLFDFINYLIVDLKVYNDEKKAKYLTVFENLLGYVNGVERLDLKQIAKKFDYEKDQTPRNWRSNILEEKDHNQYFDNIFYFLQAGGINHLLKKAYSINFKNGFLDFDFEKLRREERSNYSTIFISKILCLIHEDELVMIGDESALTLSINITENHLQKLYFINKSILNQFHSVSTKPLINFIKILFNDTIDSSFEKGNRLDYFKYSDLINKFSIQSLEVKHFIKELFECEFGKDIHINIDEDSLIIFKGISIEKSIVYAMNYISGFATADDICDVLCSEPFNLDFKKEQINPAKLDRVTAIGKIGLYVSKDVLKQKIKFDIGSGTREDILFGLINEHDRPVHIYSLYKFIFDNNFFYGDNEESERNPTKIFKSIYTIIKHYNKNKFIFIDGGYIGFDKHHKIKYSHISRKAILHLRQLDGEGKDFRYIHTIANDEYNLTEIQTKYILDRDIRQVLDAIVKEQVVIEEEDGRLKVCPLTFCEIPNVLQDVEIKELNISTLMRIDLAKLYDDGLLIIGNDGLVTLTEVLKTTNYIGFESINLKERINILK